MSSGFQSSVRDWLVQRVADRLGLTTSAVPTDRSFVELGLSSRDSVELSGDIAEFVGQPVTPTLVWENPTIDRLADVLDSRRAATSSIPTARPAEPDEPVAVVGLGCRLPGGIRGPDAFWEMLRDGVDGVGEVPAGRWERFAGSRRDAEIISRLPRSGGYLDDLDGFDAEFFGISPKEAALTDPQQRLLLEVAWEALEHAGIVPENLRASSAGVFVGVSASEYGYLTTSDLHGVDAWTGTGAASSIVANRLSYFLDLRGPSVVVDTACSSSLVAIHQACASLRSGESNTVLAAGVNALLSPGTTTNFARAGGLAADGRCKAFDAAADGVVRGEGCGVVVLKRLSDARRDGDRVLSVIRGSAVNSDGRSNGLMAPNPASQKELLHTAYRRADLDETVVDYVEAHGTGTLLGDPIEAEALGEVLGAQREPGRPLLIGSVKTNIGHLESAAGVIGLIKVVLSMRGGALPPSLHYDEANPYIPFEQARLQVVDRLRTWPEYSGIARAGVSGFGFGGTNAHVVLEAWPGARSARGGDDADGVRTLVVSGASERRMRRRAGELADWLRTPEGRAADLDDLGHTLARRRSQQGSRGAVVARDRSELVAGLSGIADGEPTAITGRADLRAGSPVWVFSGYGSQWSGMCRGLLRDEPAFEDALDAIDPEFARQCGFSLREVLTAAGGFGDVARTQLVLFGVQVALARLWRSRGIEPAAVIGHSMGEVAAAVVAGALDFADGLCVMLARSTLLSEVDSGGAGAMAVLETSAEHVAGLGDMYPGVVVAVHTSPWRCTVAGPSDEVARLVAHEQRRGRRARFLEVSGAGHTAAVEPVLGRLTSALSGLRPADPSLPVYGTSSEAPRERQLFDAAHWARNLRSPVRFSQAVRAAVEDGFRTFVEIAPHPVATVGVEETIEDAGVADAVIGYSCRRDTDDAVTLHTNLARLWVSGRVPEPGCESGRLLDLPLSAWEHQKYWVAPKPASSNGHPLLGNHVELPGGQHAWRADVGTDALPWLGDHVVHDVPVLPASAYVEMALAAASEVLGQDAAQVRRLELNRFLPLEDSALVTTTLETTGRGSARVETHSKTATGRWIRHSFAEVAPTSSEPLSQDAVGADAEPISLYPSLEAAGQNYGPAFRGVHVVRAGGGAASAEVVLPEVTGDRSQFGVHPALLDSCLQTLVAAALGPGSPVEGGLFVPVELGGIRQHDRLGERVRCHARLTATDGEVTGSLLVTGEDGAPLLEVAQVRAHALDTASVPVPLTGAFLESRWESAPLAPAEAESEAPQGSWLLLGDTDELAAALQADGERVVVGELGRPGEALQRLTEVPASPARGVVVAVEPTGDVDAGRHAVLEVAGLVRAMAEHPVAGARLWLLTRDDHPAAWGLRALVRVLAVEHPELRAAIVHSHGSAVASLLSEFRAGSGDDEVRWEGTERRVNRLCRAGLGHVDPEHVVQPGAYVITGGLGGLGLAVADWLVERGARRLVLNGRRDPSADVTAEVDRLRRAGAEVEVVTGDIGDQEVAHRLVRRAGTGLRGVVHAAGVLDDGPVVELDESVLARVWQPKVLGAWCLHEATAEIDLDWWVTFSSAAGLFGSPGQAAYATANAWMDELAHYRRSRGLPATSVQWGPWSEVGGADDALTGVIAPITPAEGVEALEAALGSDRAVLGVARFDAGRALEFLPGLGSRPFFGNLLPAGGTAGGHEPFAPDSRQAIMRRLVEGVGAVLGWESQQVPTSTPLTMLGLDSLMAVRARNTVERDFGVALPTPMLLRGSSLADIAEYLAEQLGVAGGGEPAVELGRGAGPRDATERWLAQMWRQALGRDDIGVTEDFFGLGGNDVLAEKVTAQVAERLGEPVPVAELFASPTVEGMSDLVRDRFEGCDGPVRVLSEGGANPPLFLFHPAGGPTSVYQPLVRDLGDDQPCYGLERVDEIPKLEDKAGHYIELIRTVRPQGPYRLAGWSLGGCLAYETARQLTDAGHEVELVALIDTILPLPDPEHSRQELILLRYQRFAEHVERTYGHALQLPLEEIAELDEDEQIDRVMSALADSDLGIGPAILRHQYTSYVDARVAERYEPPPYAGRVVLYRAQEAEATTTTLDPRYLRTDEALGWDAVASDLDVIPIPGDHLSMIDPPNVGRIAEHLASVLDPDTPRSGAW